MVIGGIEFKDTIASMILIAIAAILMTFAVSMCEPKSSKSDVPWNSPVFRPDVGG